jgi:hypothetical protein
MQMNTLFGRRDALVQLEADTARSLNHFARDVLPDLLPLAETASDEERDAHQGRVATLCDQAAAYLARELAGPRGGETWAVSGAGEDLAAALLRELERGGRREAWQNDLDAAPPPERWRLARDWVRAYAIHQAPQSVDWGGRRGQRARHAAAAHPRQRGARPHRRRVARRASARGRWAHDPEPQRFLAPLFVPHHARGAGLRGAAPPAARAARTREGAAQAQPVPGQAAVDLRTQPTHRRAVPADHWRQPGQADRFRPARAAAPTAWACCC